MKTIRLSALVCVLGLVGVAGLSGCGSDDQQEQASVGTVQVALTGVSSSGALYRLRNGEFSIAGPTMAQFSTESDPNAESVALDLPAGDYTIALADGWILEKEVDGEFVEAVATLESANPAPFSIMSSAQTGVLFEFRSEGEVVELGDGTLEVEINVDDLECAAPTVVCAGACVDTTSDPNNCGGCGTACDLTGASASICVNGVCEVGMCDAGRGNCDMSSLNGCETSTTSDVSNCGGCNTACSNLGGNASCDGGTCDIMCFPGRGDCSPAPGCETDTNGSMQHCGGCNTPCNPGPNSTPMCQGGMCQLQICQSGFANCNNQAFDGCERALNTDPACGSTTTVGQLSGDTGSNSLQFSDLGEKRLRYRINENDADSLFSSGRQLAVRFTLNYSGDTQYTIQAGCDDGCEVDTQTVGNGASITLRWDDVLLTDVSRDVFVNVIAAGSQSATPNACNQWTVTAVGNVNGGQVTCPAP